MAKYERKPRPHLRLIGYNYALAGAYFLTFCTHQRDRVLGCVIDGVMVHSQAGQIMQEEIVVTPSRRPSVLIDSFVVMPDHVHIPFAVAQQRATRCTSGRFESPSRTVGAAVRAMKATATRRIVEACRIAPPIWQALYHDHIIRNDTELWRYRRYIEQNPIRWK
jgi:REP element-mobilizing transposase RayT